ncbi:OR5B2 protein, partial [Crocuta crocuta]
TSMKNNTDVTDFILLGLTNNPELQFPLFIMFTLIYLVTLIGNLGMIMLILLDSHLHTPMYFFLSNLSLVDFCYSSIVTPKVMAGLLMGDKVISYNACAAQMFFFAVFATVENYLLASMAYDRYTAVCTPLHYTTTMTTRVCACLAMGSYACGVLNASINIGDTFSLSFCMSRNNTEVTEFILLGLTNAPELQIPLFVMFTLLYLINVVGNLGMMVLILLDSCLHTPMYFFLSNLSLVDFGYSTAVTPKVMAGLLIEDKVISYNACAAQMFFFAVLATVESYLLASMAYDRYAAVCKPLHYTTTMTTGVCARLAIGSYVFGFLNASVDVGNTFHLSFCKSNVIHHFFCDIPAVLSLSCSDRHVSELVLVFVATFHIFFGLLVILISYLFIFITILKMPSIEGYLKAISTCASHLTAV